MSRKKFFTEKETEYWLETETRLLPMPDGSQKPVTSFRLVWGAFDFLVKVGRKTPARLVELSLLNAQEMNLSFEESFPAVIAYLDHGLRKQYGIN
jgi:hypothetical protein